MCNPFHRSCKEYDVLAYSLDTGRIVKRQFHHHGGYNLEAGIRPGMKISLSADAGNVVCASDTNLSIHPATMSGEANRVYAGVMSSRHLFTGDEIALDRLDAGGLVRGKWKIARRAYDGEWWAACTSVSLVEGHIGPTPARLYRAWKLDGSGALRAMPQQIPFGLIDGDEESDFFGDFGDYGAGNFWASGTTEPYAPQFFVDGTTPQSVIGGDQVWCAPMADDGNPPVAGLFGFDGITSDADLREPPLSSSDEVRGDWYYRGGSQYHFDGRFAWCNRFVSDDDGPVMGAGLDSLGRQLSVTISLSRFTGRDATSSPVTFIDSPAYYYDPGSEDFERVCTQIACVSDERWHGLEYSQATSGAVDLGWLYGTMKPKIGDVVYRELDFNSLHDMEDGAVDPQWPELVRSIDSPFGTVDFEGSPVSALAKDIFVQDGFLYALLPDESNPYYWRRLVKIDLSDFSTVWERTPPKEWQCYHSLSVSGSRVWVAVSASDGSVFVDPD